MTSRAETYGQIVAIAVSLAKRQNGMSSKDFRAATGIASNCAGTRIAAMAKSGRLHRASAIGHMLRWFDTAERANAWVVANGGWKEKPSYQAVLAAKRSKAIGAPVHIPRGAFAFAAGPADMSRAKLTVCKSTGHDIRFQLPPGAVVVGGWRTAGIGRYLDDGQ